MLTAWPYRRDVELQSQHQDVSVNQADIPKTRESTFGLLNGETHADHQDATIPRAAGWLVLVGDGIHNLVVSDELSPLFHHTLA